VWLGLFGGVMRHDLRTERDFDLYTPANTGGQLLSTGVYTIEVDRDGDKWVGTYGGGLAKFDGSRWTTYSPYGWGSPADYRNTWTAYVPGRGLGDLWVYDVAFDRRGRMWVATWKGVSLFDGDGFTTYSVDEGLVDKWVYAIAIDRHNVMWFGTEGGVTRFDGSTWKSYTHADGLGLETEQVVKNPDYTFGNPHHIDPSKQATASNPNYVISAAVDRRNHKWFGTWGGGISRFDGSSWTTYSKADGLGGNFVFSQAVDHNGILWAGTDGGVSWFDGTRWRTYTTRDGLIDNFVYSIGVDDEGNKWFGTRVGISRFADPDRTPLRSLFHRLGLSR
jgi:ligand-binding sensor domain-containing protein